MRTSYPGYTRRTDHDLDKLWAECVFAFDASALLDLYRLTPEARDTVLNILDRLKERLWLPHQAGLEYHDNRIQVIATGLCSYSRIPELARDIAKSYRKSLDTYRQYRWVEAERWVGLLDETVKKIEDTISKQERVLGGFPERDPVEEKLNKIFDGKVGPPYTDMHDIYVRAEQRLQLSIPPGFKDAATKKDFHRYGDVVLWLQLLDYSVAGKRYVLYEKKDDGDIEIVEPKAHGLGYFYPPKDSPERWEKDHDVPKWIFELWNYIVRGALGMKRKKPSWFELPVMMKITLSTPHHALQNLGKCDLTRPHNFMMMPKISPFGYPPGVNPANPRFTLITRFTSNREEWIKSQCINIHDINSPTYRLKFDYEDDGVSVSPVNFYQLAESYQNHPEAKSLGPDGKPCEFDTCGLLQRAHILAGEHIPIGKESDRHWEEGEDISLLEFKAIRYQRRGKVTATPEQLERIEEVPKREFIRRGINQHTLEKICSQIPVRASKLAKVLKVLQQWELEQQNQTPEPGLRLPQIIAGERTNGASL